MAHPVDLLVDCGFFLDIGIGARYVGFGLIVIVIGYEVFDGVVGEEVLELAIELGGQRLVWREDEGRAAGLGDDLGGGEGLARAGDAEQDLIGLAIVGAFEQLGNRRGLVAGGGVFGIEAEGNAALVLLERGGAVGLPRLVALDLLAALGDDLFQRGNSGRDAGG